jgi:hypothetical protein
MVSKTFGEWRCRTFVAYLATARQVLWILFGSLPPAYSAWEILVHSPPKAALSMPREPLPAAPSLEKRAVEPTPPGQLRVSGRVVDSHGDPIADAEVWLENMSVEGGSNPSWLGADSNGRFNAPQAPSGLYTITAAARGFLPRAIAVELDTDVGDLRLELATAPPPRALVVDPEGRPVALAIVAACSNQSNETTLVSASDGTVDFGPGASGCLATAHHARFSHSTPVRLASENRATLRLERGGAIEGVVTDSNGRALSDATISVTTFNPAASEGPLAGSMPDLGVAFGRDFRLSGLAPGVYVLGVNRRARRDEDENVGELASATFEVEAGRVVRGVHIVVDTSDPPDTESPRLPWVVARQFARTPRFAPSLEVVAEDDAVVEDAPEEDDRRGG